MADARVKARAEELIKSGIKAGPAAQQAYAEIYGNISAEQAKSVKQAAATQDFNVATQQAKTAEAAKLEAAKTITSIEQSKQDFVRRRSAELQAMGFSEAEATSQANKQFDTQVTQPVGKGFGTREEKKRASEVDVAGLGIPFVDVYAPEREPLNLTANKPTKIQETLASFQPKTSFEPSMAQPEKVDTTGAAVNWDEAKKYIREMLPASSDEQVGINLDAIKKEYDRQYLKQLQAGLSNKEASKKAIDITFQNFQDLATQAQTGAIRTTDMGEARRAAPTSEADVFKPGYTPGQGIPALSEEQRRIVSDTIDIARERKIAEIKRTSPDKKVYVLTDGTKVDSKQWAEGMSPIRSTESIKKTDEEIRREAEVSIPKQWYEDPAQYQVISKDPSKFQSYGVLSAKTPYGGEKETTLGVLLKGMMAVPNIVAGAGGALAYEVLPSVLGDEGTMAAARQKERAAKEPVFADNPILFNVYNNMGFFGEANQASEILNLEGLPKYLTLAGGFAADMLDPSLDVLHAGATGARAGAGLKTASKAAGLERGASDILKYGSKVGIAQLADNSAALKLFTPSALVASPGDIRNLVAIDAAREMAAATDATSIAAKGDVGFAEVKAALQERGLENTQFAKDLEKKAASGGDIGAHVEAAKADTKLAEVGAYKSAEGASMAIDDIVAGRPPRTAPRDDIAKAIGSAASKDAALLAKIKASENKSIAGYLGSMTPAEVQAVKDEAISSAAKNAIYKATRDQQIPNNMVAVTKNTFATKDSASKILSEISNSDIGKLASELKNQNVVYKTTEIGEVIPAKPVQKAGQVPFEDVVMPKTPSKTVSAVFELVGDQGTRLKDITRGLESVGAITNAEAEVIIKNLGQNSIAPRDVRKLIDAQVDVTARGKYSPVTTGGAQLQQLAVQRQLDFNVPVDSRSFVKDNIKLAYEKVSGFFNKEPSYLTAGQQSLLRQAQKEVSSLDTRLGNDMNKLLNDEAYREAVTGSAAPISRQDALAYNIVGPKQGVIDAESLSPQYATDKAKSTIETIINSMFYNKENKQDVFDMFTGLGKKFSSPLSYEGRIALYGEAEALLNQAAARVVAEPTTLWAEVSALAKRMESEIIPNKVNLKSTTGELVNEFKGGTIPPEAQVSAYLSSKATDIENELITSLVNDQLSQNDINLFKYLPPDQQAIIESRMSAGGVSTEAIGYNSIISNIVEKKVSEKGFNASNVDDVFDAFYHKKSLAASAEQRQLSEERLKFFLDKTDAEIKELQAKTKQKISELEERIIKNKKDIEISYDDKMYKSEGKLAELKRKLNINIDIKKKQDIAAFLKKKEELQAALEKALTNEQNMLNDSQLYLDKLKAETEKARAKTQATIEGREAKAEKLISKREELLKAKKEKLEPEMKARLAKQEELLAKRKEAISGKAEEGISRREKAQDIRLETKYEIDKPAFINKYNADPVFRKAIDNLMSNGEAIADGIIQKNGLKNMTSPDEVMKAADDIRAAIDNPDMYAQLKLQVGGEAAEQIKDAFNKVYSKTIEQMDNAIRTKNEHVFWRSAKYLGETVQSLRYLLLLTLRPRFHGANLSTAADIIYSTTGKLPNPLHVAEAANILTEPSSFKPIKKLVSDDRKVIFTDKAGRSWTKGELRDILEYKSGSSSQGFSATGPEEIMGQIQGGAAGSFERAKAAAKELAQTEDLLFRYTAFRSAIDAGRSEAEAIEIARRSMYDSADITDIEKPLKNSLMFYSWVRNNVVNAADNMTKAQGWNRITKVAKAKNAVERTLVQDEQVDFAPAYLQTRILLNSLPFSPERDKLLSTAPLPTLEGIATVAELMKLEGGAIFQRMISPELKLLLDIQTGMEQTFDYIPPEHISYFEIVAAGLPGVSSKDLMETITGGQVAVEFKPPIDKGVTQEGYDSPVAYRLITDEQKAAYKTFYNAMSFQGATTIAQDYAKMAGATEGTPSYGRGWLEAIGTSFGLVTPSPSYISEKQALFRLKAQKAEADKLARAVTEVQASEFAAEAAAAGTGESELSKARAEADKVRTSFRSQFSSSLEVVAELRKLQRALPPYDTMTDQARVDEAAKLQAEYKRLAALEKASKTPSSQAPSEQPSSEESRAPRERAPRERAPRERTRRER